MGEEPRPHPRLRLLSARPGGIGQEVGADSVDRQAPKRSVPRGTALDKSDAQPLILPSLTAPDSLTALAPRIGLWGCAGRHAIILTARGGPTDSNGRRPRGQPGRQTRAVTPEPHCT